MSTGYRQTCRRRLPPLAVTKEEVQSTAGGMVDMSSNMGQTDSVQHVVVAGRQSSFHMEWRKMYEPLSAETIGKNKLMFTFEPMEPLPVETDY